MDWILMSVYSPLGTCTMFIGLLVSIGLTWSFNPLFMPKKTMKI